MSLERRYERGGDPTGGRPKPLTTPTSSVDHRESHTTSTSWPPRTWPCSVPGWTRSPAERTPFPTAASSPQWRLAHRRRHSRRHPRRPRAPLRPPAHAARAARLRSQPPPGWPAPSLECPCPPREQAPARRVRATPHPRLGCLPSLGGRGPAAPDQERLPPQPRRRPRRPPSSPSPHSAWPPSFDRRTPTRTSVSPADRPSGSPSAAPRPPPPRQPPTRRSPRP
ncbi:hypothetical protein I4F81_012209 [Pyropia yezoensis]|uniref:Uncharacterized protein n=1 Tax=Pyropia yezoensis TaxID=2788 RepID=A0ACC3CIP9_PYRYE|nr:hypothetical protein I4F81_012209 [Neopyropia yezoensis]